MKLNELSEMMSEAVKKQDFTSAAEIKEKIDVLEVSKQALMEEMTPKPVAVASQVLEHFCYYHNKYFHSL